MWRSWTGERLQGKLFLAMIFARRQPVLGCRRRAGAAASVTRASLTAAAGFIGGLHHNDKMIPNKRHVSNCADWDLILFLPSFYTIFSLALQP